MAFKNLEQRFNEKVNQLYAAATTKFDNGRASTGRNDEPLIVRRPGEGYFTVADRIGGRSIPLNSSLQDVKRLTLFTLSTRGIAFLAKQQLLQTGNTFEQTRLINPVFAIGNAVPFLHLRRHLRPITGGPGGPLIGKTDTSYANLRRIGQLQKSTYNSFTEGKSNGIGGFLKKLAGPITSTISAVTAKKNIGEEFGYDEDGWKKTRPELNTEVFYPGLALPNKFFKYGGQVETQTFTKINYGVLSNTDRTYKTYLNITDENSRWAPIISRRHVPFGQPFAEQTEELPRGEPIISERAGELSLTETYNNFEFEDGAVIPTILEENRIEYGITNRSKWYEEEANGNGQQMPYLKYFTGDPESITDGSQFPDSTNARVLAESRPDKSKKISYIKDPSNADVLLERNVLEPYKYINGADDSFEDAITVSFAIGKNDHIKFRAFITDFNENASPQYQSLQYIGRVEKFINYTGVQREASFKLSILAFSKDELENVWRRINYLTGLVFPYGFTKGILQPNIVRLTIGNVYVDQPGYISSLGKVFNQVSETWDLDKQVPIGATLDMKFTIIEKTTKVADSPFYAITENLQGFSPTIEVAQTLNNTLDPKKAPSVGPITERIEQRRPVVVSNNDVVRRTNFLPPAGAVQVPTINIPNTLPDLSIRQPTITFSGR